MMNGLINDSVALFYAKDEFENYILINEINEANKDKEYVCPICGGVVRPRCLESTSTSMHFYHLNANTCNNETAMHFWYKNKFIDNGDIFYIDNEEYICDKVIIERAYKTSFGIYKPDATIITKENKEIFIEYNYTNKKNVDNYSDMWLELDVPVVEIDVKYMMKNNNCTKRFSSIYNNGILKHHKRSKQQQIIDRHIKENKIEDRLRIKYLNGFLRDVYRYNSGKISIDEVMIIIDNMNELDLICVPKLLKSLKCNTILDDYMENRCKYVDSLIKEYLSLKGNIVEKFSEYYSFCFTRKYSKFNSIRFINTIKLSLKREYYSLVEYGHNIFGKFNIDDIYKSIDIMYDEIIRKIKDDEKMSHINYLNSKRKSIDNYMKEYLKYYTYYLEEKNRYIKSYTEYTRYYKGVSRKERYINYIKNEYNELLYIEKQELKQNEILYKIHNGIIERFDNKYYKLNFKYEFKYNNYNKLFTAYNDSVKYCSSRYDTLKLFNDNLKYNKEDDAIRLTIDSVVNSILDVDAEFAIKHMRYNEIYRNKNKVAYISSEEINKNMFKIITYIDIKKKYYKNETIYLSQVFGVDLNNNSISFTFNNKQTLIYVEDKYDMYMFIKDIELKMTDYCKYYINELC